MTGGAEALADAYNALLPAEVTNFDGQVANPDGTFPTPPWVHTGITLPDAGERSLSRQVHSYVVRVRHTVCGGNVTAVRQYADLVHAAVEGARPVATGWSCGPVELVNARAPVEDRDVKIPALAAHPMVGVLEYAFTATATDAGS